jgi:hypothetical protein
MLQSLTLKRPEPMKAKQGAAQTRQMHNTLTKKKESRCHGKVEEQCHTRAERGNACHATRVHE